MSVLGDMHSAHKARRDRLWGGASPKPKLSPPVPVINSLTYAQGCFLTERVVRLACKEIERRLPKEHAPFHLIIRTVAERYGITEIDIVSDRQDRSVVRPRQIVMYLAKSMTVLSLTEIARRLGGKDHTTIIYGIRKIKGMTDTDQHFHSQVHDLRQEILGAM